LLLVFTDPRCSPCLALLPDIGGWQRVYGDRLAIALISTGDPEINRAMTASYGMERVLLQQEHEVADAYELAQAPAAVLVRPNGSIGSEPAYGVNAIRRLVAETLGLVVPTAPERAIQPAGRGQAAPTFWRLSLDERVVDLAAYQGRPVVLLFWSPACTHCQDLLPRIRAVEALSNRPELIVISRGAPDLNRAAGLTSLVVLDDSHELADAFGIGGTPAAVVIDGNGIIASEGFRGSGQVQTLLDRMQLLATSHSTMPSSTP
jgi:thiol-disulfide isomerase/thioredoxin